MGETMLFENEEQIRLGIKKKVEKGQRKETCASGNATMYLVMIWRKEIAA